MKIFSKSMLALAMGLSMALVGCSDNEPGGKGSNGGYGTLGGNLITIGSTRDVTYTGCVLLGTVDFPKITSDHTYGIVYMEALRDPNFDYDSKLQYGGHSGRNDKEDYDCTSLQITNSAADGKFEKQIVDLKPATKYYYRSYVRIGNNFNYSSVESFTTKNPGPEIKMSTGDATDIFAVAGTMNGVVNIGKLQDINEDQTYGFIYTSEPKLNTAEKLTYEYYEEWERNHFETDDLIDSPSQVTTITNLNGRISIELENLRPGTTYYYRTFFEWNGKYFYSPEVKTLKTNGPEVITVGTNKAEEVTHNSALLSATMPYSVIGIENVRCGFMISKVYSNASEFTMENAVSWNDHRYYPDADVYYLTGFANDKDFSLTINGLDPETTYYIRSFINLGNFDEPYYIYGSMQSFRTEEFVLPEPSEAINVYSEPPYPWTENNGVWTSGNRSMDNTSSNLYVTVNHVAGQTFSCNYTVSSEANYDILYVIIGGESQATYSGTRNGVYSQTFTFDGQTTLNFRYYKDGSSSSGNDCATVSNFMLQ